MSARDELRLSIREAFRKEAAKRYQCPDMEWVRNEQIAMVDAANLWVSRHGQGRPINLPTLESVETRALGHVDYADKVALYVAEWVLAGTEQLAP